MCGLGRYDLMLYNKREDPSVREQYCGVGGKISVLGTVLALLCGLCQSTADVPKSTSSLVHSDIKAFLTAPSFEIEPWFAAGVTNGDRSPDFMQRMHAASAKGNAIVQGFLGMLLVKGEGVPSDVGHGMRLLHTSANPAACRR